jgi:hypothetical protein
MGRRFVCDAGIDIELQLVSDSNPGYFGQLGQGDEADKKMPRR